jgi:hypothetical protein
MKSVQKGAYLRNRDLVRYQVPRVDRDDGFHDVRVFDGQGADHDPTKRMAYGDHPLYSF